MRKPKRKPKIDKGSIHLTRELFDFEKCADGVTRLFIGTKTNNIGYLSFKTHRHFKMPNSIPIVKRCGQYIISFCYEMGEQKQLLPSNAEHFAYLKGATKEYLNDYVVGIDRGVAIPAKVGDQSFDFTPGQKKNKDKAEQYIKKLQRMLAKKKNKTSKCRAKTKHRIAKYHVKCSNIRKDFCHQTSH